MLGRQNIYSARLQEHMRWLIFLVLVLLAACGILLYLLLQRRRQAAAEGLDGLFIPRHLPTGDTLARLVWRFQHLADSELLGSRLARLYAVLFDPDLVLDYLDDPYLVPQVETGRLVNNTALFRCVAAVEQAVEGRCFGETPANTLGAYLRAEFRKHGWPWPSHPIAWKQFFLEHYADRLLKESKDNSF